jgi:SAM-dependent methyltransferase
MANQSLIWQHFQNAGHDSFAGAKPRLDFLLRLIERLAQGTPAVLNIGAGDGYFERCAKSRGWTIHSLDPDAQAIARLQAQGIEAHVGTVEDLPLADASLDFVVVSEVLEHLTDDQCEQALARIHQALKPRGRIIGTVPHAENLREQEVVCPQCANRFHRWGHQRAFTLPQVSELLSTKFTVEKLRRTAFVGMRRNPRQFLKGCFRIALAKLGEPIAHPTIWWVARK